MPLGDLSLPRSLSRTRRLGSCMIGRGEPQIPLVAEGRVGSRQHGGPCLTFEDHALIGLTAVGGANLIRDSTHSTVWRGSRWIVRSTRSSASAWPGGVFLQSYGGQLLDASLLMRPPRITS